MRDLNLFLEQLVQSCPAMQSVWLVGERANGDGPDAHGPFEWDLVAFADLPTLRGLREATDLHRPDVLLRVVTDGDRFEAAWGRPPVSGSLYQWDWLRASEDEAFYSEAHWSGPPRNRSVERRRLKAVCLWQPEDVDSAT